MIRVTLCEQTNPAYDSSALEYDVLTGKIDGLKLCKTKHMALVAAHELGHWRQEKRVNSHLAFVSPACAISIMRDEAEAWRIGLPGYITANGPLTKAERRYIAQMFRSYVLVVRGWREHNDPAAFLWA